MGTRDTDRSIFIRGWLHKSGRRRGASGAVQESSSVELRYFVVEEHAVYFGTSEDIVEQNASMVLRIDAHFRVTSIDSQTLALSGAFDKEGKEYLLHFEQCETKLMWESALLTAVKVAPLRKRRLRALTDSSAALSQLSARHALPEMSAADRTSSGDSSSIVSADLSLDRGWSDDTGGIEAAAAAADDSEQRRKARDAHRQRTSAGFVVSATVSGVCVYLRAVPCYDSGSVQPTGIQLQTTTVAALATIVAIDSASGRGYFPLMMADSASLCVTGTGALVVGLDGAASLTPARLALDSILMLSPPPKPEDEPLQLVLSGSAFVCSIDSAGVWTFRGGTQCRAEPVDDPTGRADGSPLKIVLLGGAGAGKTTLLQWLQSHSAAITNTVGVSFRQTVGAVERVLCFDVGGAIQVISITELPANASMGLLKSHCERAHVLLFVFNYTDAFSLSWLATYAKALDAGAALRGRKLIFVGTRKGDARVVVDAYRAEQALRDGCEAASVVFDPAALWSLPVIALDDVNSSFGHHQPGNQSADFGVSPNDAPSLGSSDANYSASFASALEAQTTFVAQLREALRLGFCEALLLRGGVRAEVASTICSQMAGSATQLSVAADDAPFGFRLALDALGVLRPFHCLAMPPARPKAHATLSASPAPTRSPLLRKRSSKSLLRDRGGGGGAADAGGLCLEQLHPHIHLVLWLLAAVASGDILAETIMLNVEQLLISEHEASQLPAVQARDLLAAACGPSRNFAECFLTGRDVAELYAVCSVTLHGQMLAETLRAMDIDGDQVVLGDDFAQWWTQPDAVTLKEGIFAALFAGLFKSRLAVAPHMLASVGATDTRRGERKATVGSPMTNLAARRGPSGVLRQLGGAIGSAIASAVQTSSPSCGRCGAELTLFRSGKTCAHCNLAFCSECISLSNTVDTTKRLAQVLLCYTCQGIDRPRQWEEGDGAKSCHLCTLPFTFVRRRHHCRQCGAPCCGDCSPNTANLPNYKTPQRVCLSCEAATTVVEERRRRKNSHSAAFELQRTSTGDLDILLDSGDDEAFIGDAIDDGRSSLHRNTGSSEASSPTVRRGPEPSMRARQLANRRAMTREIEYTLPWHELYDSDAERELFRRCEPPPLDPTAPRSEYVVLVPGLTEVDEKIVIDMPSISEADLDLMAPDVFSAPD